MNSSLEINVSAVNKNGDTALRYVFRRKMSHYGATIFEILKQLPRVRDEIELDKASSPASCKYNFAELSAKNGKLDLLKILVEEFRYPLEKRSENGSSLLFLASAGNHLECVKFLIEKGSILDSRCTEKKYTPLMIAIEKDYSDIVKSLLNAGTDALRLVSSNGESAEMLAMKSDNRYIEALVRNPLDMLTDEDFFKASCRREEGPEETFILASAAGGKVEILRAHWRDEYWSIVNWRGENALCIAIRNNQIGIVRFLQQSFSATFVGACMNLTPLDYGRLFPQFEGTQFLSDSVSVSGSSVMIEQCRAIRALIDGKDLDASMELFKSMAAADENGVNGYFLGILLEEFVQEGNLDRLQIIGVLIRFYAIDAKDATVFDADLVLSFAAKYREKCFWKLVNNVALFRFDDLEKYFDLLPGDRSDDDARREVQVARQMHMLNVLERQKADEANSLVEDKALEFKRLALYFERKLSDASQSPSSHDSDFIIVHDVKKETCAAGSTFEPLFLAIGPFFFCCIIIWLI